MIKSGLPPMKPYLRQQTANSTQDYGGVRRCNNLRKGEKSSITNTDEIRSVIVRRFAETFSNVSSNNNYSPEFQLHKDVKEREIIYFNNDND